MNAPLPANFRFDIKGFVEAIGQNDTRDVFKPALNATQWDVLSSYMQPFALEARQVLIQQGSSDRSLYLVESGSLTVHYEDSKQRLRIAVVSPGSAVGEGAFFTREPRTATVQAAAPSKVWCLTAIRFTELSNRQPGIALAVAMALGSLVARRLANKPKRVAVT